MQNLKCVMIGDGAVGKTSLAIRYVSNEFPSQYIPTVFDNYSQNMVIDGKPVNLGLWDTAGQEDYDRLRPLSYPGTDVFLMCYSIVSRSSFDNLHRWGDEIEHHCPEAAVLLLGLKCDVQDKREVQAIEGRDFARSRGWKFAECSALTGENLNNVFDLAAKVAISRATESAGHRSNKKLKWRKWGKRKDSDNIDSNSCTSRERILSATERLSAGHSDAVWQIAIAQTPIGEQLFSASRDGTIRCWDTSTCQCVGMLVGHTDEVLDVVVDKGRGGALLSTSTDGTCRSWSLSSVVQFSPNNPQTAIIEADLVAESDERIMHMKCISSETASTVFIGYASGSIIEWSFDNSQATKLREFVGPSAISQLAVLSDEHAESPAGNLIVASCADGAFCSWGCDSLFGSGPTLLLSANVNDEVLQMATAIPDDSAGWSWTRCVAADMSGGVKVWGVSGTKSEPTLALLSRLEPHANAINCLTVFNEMVYTASRDGTLCAIHLIDLCVSRRFRGHRDTVRTCAVSSDGTVLISGGKSGTTLCHDIVSGLIQWSHDGHKDFLNCSQASTAGVWTGGRDGIVIQWKPHPAWYQSPFVRVCSSRATQRAMNFHRKTGSTVAFILLVIDTLQISAFAFIARATENTDWGSLKTFEAASSPFQLEVSGLPYVPIFSASIGFCAVLCVGAMLSYLIVSRVDRSTTAEVAWAFLRVGWWVASQPLLIPLIRTMLLSLVCTRGQPENAASGGAIGTCWTFPHLLVAIIAAIVTLVFIPIALRVASCGGDIARVAVYFWGTLVHDSFDSAKTHSFSQRSAVFGRAKAFTSVLLVVWTLFFDASATAMLVVVLLATLALSSVLFWAPEFHGELANVVRAVSMGLVCCINAFALTIVSTRDLEYVKNWYAGTTFAATLGTGVVFGAGLWLKLQRQRLSRRIFEQMDLEPASQVPKLPTTAGTAHIDTIILDSPEHI